MERMDMSITKQQYEQYLRTSAIISLIYRNAIPIQGLGFTADTYENLLSAYEHLKEDNEKLVQFIDRAKYLTSFQYNIHQLGYYITKDQMERLMLMNVDLWEGCHYTDYLDIVYSVLKAAKGADLKYITLHPTFTAELEENGEDPYLYAIIHYITDGTVHFNKEGCDCNALNESAETFMRSIYDDTESEATGYDRLQVVDLYPAFLCSDIVSNLLLSNIPISEDMMGHIEMFIKDIYMNKEILSIRKDFETRILSRGPIKCKETFAAFLNILVDHRLNYDYILDAVNNATDVLRFFVKFSDPKGDVSLSKTPSFMNHPPKYVRKLMMDMLLRCPNLEDDFKRYPEYWKRALERIHPYKFTDTRYEYVQKACDLLYKKQLRSLNSKITKLVENNNASFEQFKEMMRRLESFPGIYLRKFDYFVRRYGDGLSDDLTENHTFMKFVCDSLYRVVKTVPSTRMIVELMSNYANRIVTDPDARYCKPKGKRYYVKFPVQDQHLCNPKYEKNFMTMIYSIFYKEMLRRLQDLPYLGSVFISPSAALCTLPTELRESNGTGLNILPRGSRIRLEGFMKIPEDKDGNIVFVPYIHWTNVISEKEETRIDIDLSALFLSEDFSSRAHCSYRSLNLYHNKVNYATHSGDFVNGGKPDGDGVSELILIRRNQALEAGFRYVLIQVHDYTCVGFDSANTFFGFQVMCETSDSFDTLNRQRINNKITRPIVDPKSTIINSNITKQGSDVTMCVIDLKENVLVWMDMQSFGQSSVDLTVQHEDNRIETMKMSDFRKYINADGNNVIRTATGSVAQLEAMMKKPRCYMGDLLKLHVDARGVSTNDPIQADVIFALPTDPVLQNARDDQRILTPFMTDQWLNEFLPVLDTK